MEQVIQEIQSILAGAFPGATAELELYPGGDKVGGSLIWDGFLDVQEIDRQRQISRALREKLGDDFRATTTTILAFTPWEVAVMREG